VHNLGGVGVVVNDTHDVTSSNVADGAVPIHIKVAYGHTEDSTTHVETLRRSS